MPNELGCQEENIIAYISGYLVSKAYRKFKCDTCKNMRTFDDSRRDLFFLSVSNMLILKV